MRVESPLPSEGLLERDRGRQEAGWIQCEAVDGTHKKEKIINKIQ